MTSRRLSFTRRALTGIGATVLAAGTLVAPAQAGVAGPLTIKPLGWNVIGIDKVNAALGPNEFPIGARVCNEDSAALTDVTAEFEFTGLSDYISLASPALLEFGTVAGDSCVDAWYTVEVDRDLLAINASRPFAITADSTETAEVSTPLGRELYVEGLAPDEGLSITSIEVPTGDIKVGDEVTFAFEGSSGVTFEQFLTAQVLPSDLFAVRSVKVTYDTPASPYENDQFYADGCGWVNDPLSLDYRTCGGPEGVPGGLAGGDFRAEVTADAIAAGTADISSFFLSYFRGYFLYNGDYATKSTTSVTVVPAVPAIHLDKVFAGLDDTDDDGVADAGETLNWVVVATNTGETALGSTIVDDELTGDSQSCLSLAIGETCELETSYEITDADVTAGEVVNQASVTATSRDGEVSDEAESTIDLNNPPMAGAPSITIDKIFAGFNDSDDDGIIDEGEVVGWVIAAVNNGAVTLTDVAVEDAMAATSKTCATVTPGKFCATIVEYTATAEDVTAEEIVNEVTVTAQSPGGEVTSSDTDTRSMAAPGDAEEDELTLTKVLADHDDTDSNGDIDAGEIITWTVTAINSGAASLADVTIDDALTGDSHFCGVLVPGALCSMDTSYIVTAADVTATSVTNVATAVGTSVLSEETAEATDTEDVGPNPIGLIKVFTSHDDANDNDVVDAGEKLNWTVTATNNTDVAMTDVVITDPLTTDTVTCATLAAGATCVLTTDYTVLEADVTAKAVTNTASVTAVQGDETFTNDATATHDFPDKQTGAVTGGGLFWFLTIGAVLGLSGWFASRRRPVMPSE